MLRNKTSPAGGTSGPPGDVTPETVMEWLGGKSAAWHQEFYALLFEEYLAATYRREERATALGGLRIVLLASGGHGFAGETFFGSDGAPPDDMLRRANPETYTTGKGKEKENARAFLEGIGVREVGEAEVVEIVLKARYTVDAELPDEEVYRNDLVRFVGLVEANPGRGELFGEYFIFECEDGQWRTPDEVFIDLPYRDTGLSTYYTARGIAADRFRLADGYQHRIAPDRFIDFALAAGAVDRLRIEETTCERNPHKRELEWVRPLSKSRYRVDKDYHVPGLDRLLTEPNAELSKLVWRTLTDQPDGAWAEARFRYNTTYDQRTAPSQLVSLLRDAVWVPQTGGHFVRPAEAARERLPGGFPFDPAWDWLAVVHFGRNPAAEVNGQIQREALAIELGFDNAAALERAKRFAALPAERQQEILSEWEHRTAVELPERESPDPARRAARVTELAAEAPERRTEERPRSVSVNRDGVKQEAGEYLRQQYTTDGGMICQACRKHLPFKLLDGTDYFERVEFLHGFRRHHKQNYLALCPNHAAMFRHANGSTDDLKCLVAAAGNEITILLAQREVAVHFTATHLIDLKAVLRADERESEAAELAPRDCGESAGAIDSDQFRRDS